MLRTMCKIALTVCLAFIACVALYLFGASPVYADGPIANDDTYTTTEDIPLTITLVISGVLGNDTDADGDPLTATLQTAPTNGMLLLNADGTFIYTPTQHFSGTDSFIYQARDRDALPAVAYWPFEEGSGTATADASGNGHDGTLTNGPVFSTIVPLTTTFPNTYSLAFDGSNDYVAIPSHADLNLGTYPQRTVTAWFSVTDKSIADQQVIWEEGGRGSGLNICVYDGALYAGVWRSSSGNWLNTTAITSGRWHHVALVLDSSAADVLHMYLDGQLVASGSGPQLGSHSGAIAIGGVDNDSRFSNYYSISGDGKYFGGLIDDVRVYNLALSAVEVAQTMTTKPNQQCLVDQATVTITVTADPDPPQAVDDAYKVQPGGSLSVAVALGVLGNDSDPDGDTLTATPALSPTNGDLTLDPDGSFVYTPTAGFQGVDTFTYIASDGALTDTATVTLTVRNFCFVEIDGNLTTDFSSVDAAALQLAVDAVSPGGTVKVAGTCAGMAVITQPLTLQGGYITSTWTAPQLGEVTVLDGLGATDVLSITVPGVTVDGFTIRNGAQDGIVASTGGFTVTNNTFSGDNNGVHLAIDETLAGGAYAVPDVVVISNTFAITGTGVYWHLDLNGSSTAVTVTVGNVDILSNTFAISGSHDGINMGPFDVTHVDSGQIALGAVTISGNRIDGGGRGIDFQGNLDYITDTPVTVGDVTVAGNTLRNQTGTAIYIDYYDAEYWDGASAGTFGQLVIRDNDVACSAAGCDGIYVSDVGYMYSYYDSSSASAGDILIEGNRVDVGGYGVYVYYAYLGNLYGTSSASLGDTWVSGNVITSTNSSGIYLESDYIGENVYSDTVTTLGAIHVTSNTVVAGSDGIYVYHDAAEYMYGNAAVSIDDLTIAGNVITATDDGIYVYYYETGYTLYDSAVLTVGNTLIQRNQIDAGSEGIYLGNDEFAAYTYGDARVTVGEQHIVHNQVRTSGSKPGIYVYNYESGIDMHGTAQFTMGDQYVNDNVISATLQGVYVEYDEVGYDVYSDTVTTLGQMHVTSNTIRAGTEGVYVEYDDVGTDVYNDAVTTLGQMHVTSNTIRAGTEGIYVYLYDVGYGVYNNAVTTLGQTHVTSNTIRAGTEGIYVHLEVVAYEVYDNAQVFVGDFDVAANRVLGGSEGVELYYSPGEVNVYVDVTATVQLPTYNLVNNVLARSTNAGVTINGDAPVNVVHNTIVSPTVGGGVGIHVLTGTVRVTNTIVASYTTGISNTGGLVSEDYTLFAGTTVTTAGGVTSGGHSLSNANAGLNDPANDDYALLETSDAVDSGVDAGVTVDIDGFSRPQGAGYDIGAFEVELFTLRVVVDGNGTVSSDPAGIDCGSDCTQVFGVGTVVTLTAAPGSGAYLYSWSGDLVSADTLAALVMGGDKTITATFSTEPPVTYTLTVNVVGSGGVVPASGSYISGTVLNLSATADPGWYFGGWSGDLGGADNPANLTMDGDKVVTATFVTEPVVTYTLSVHIAPAGSGSVTVVPSATTYVSGTVVELTAVPALGYEFTKWTGDVPGPADANPATITMTKNVSVTATFDLTDYYIYLPVVLRNR